MRARRDQERTDRDNRDEADGYYRKPPTTRGAPASCDGASRSCFLTQARSFDLGRMDDHAESRIANAERVRRQERCAGGTDAIDPDPVPTPARIDEEAPVTYLEDAVISRHGRVVQHDVRVRGTPDVD